jgi:uncharacterized membrane protein
MSEATLTERAVDARREALESLRTRAVARTAAASVAVRVVYAAVLAYAALFVFAAVVHFLVYRTARPDLGNMVQAIWSTLHGHTLEFTTVSGNQTSRLGFHVDPFLLLLVPLYWLWSSPLLLVVVQAIGVSSGALPVFWLGRKHLGSDRAAVHFAFAYLLYPATQFNAFTVTSSFHSVALAVPFVLFAIWFLDEDRLVAFALFALLAATTKEEIPLAVGTLGIWYALRKGRRVAGGAILVLGAGATLFNFLWVIPHYSPSGIDPFVGRYQEVGTTPGGIFHTLFSDPTAFVHAIATGHKAAYVALLLVPFLGLWLLEPLLLLGALPDLAINLLSSKSDQTSLPFHWTAGIVPFVVAASVMGTKRLKERAVGISLWAMMACASLALFSPIHFLKHDVQQLSSPITSARAHALALIPAEAPVSASNRLGGHLSERRYSFAFPFVGPSNWIVVDSNDDTYTDPAALRRAVRAYTTSAEWRTVYSSRGVTVLERLRPSHTQG